MNVVHYKQVNKLSYKLHIIGHIARDSAVAFNLSLNIFTQSLDEVTQCYSNW